jgi:hypothetical protein
LSFSPNQPSSEAGAPAVHRAEVARRKSPGVLILVASVGLVAIVAFGVWVLTREAPFQARRLPDGSLLELKGVTYGQRHRLVEQKLWQKLLAPLLPPRLQGKEVGPVGTPTAGSLVVWFSPKSRPSEWGGGRLMAVDEHGCRIGSGFALPGLTSTAYRIGFLEVFPRRTRLFRLQVYGRDVQKPVAEFAVANPTPGPHPTWAPEPLPLRKRQGGLEVTLTALTTGLTLQDLRRGQPAVALDDRYVAPNPAMQRQSWSRASFSLRDKGVATDRWQIAAVTVSDAAGNTLAYTRNDTHRRVPGTTVVSTLMGQECLRSRTDRTGRAWAAFPGLCTREAAWKLRATFARLPPPEERLPPDLRWTVSGVAVPRPWTARTADGHPITGQGGAWKLQGVLGKGAFGTDPPLLKGANVRLIVTSTIGRGLTLALRATDDQGRKLVCSPGGSTHMGPNYKWWFDLTTPPGAKRLSLTFVGWKGRSVEFLARPTPA